MTSLLGAWALDPRRPVDSELPHEIWRSMRETLPAKGREVTSLRLRLSAQQLFMRGSLRLAVEGFLALGDASPASLLSERAPAPEGHFALAHCHGEGSSAELTLVRGLSGGERLYIARCAKLLLFSSSIRPLLVHPQVERSLDPAVVHEMMLVGMPVFGCRTAIRGIEEVLPGHALVVGERSSPQRWHYRAALESPRGKPPELARAFRRALAESVNEAMGRQRPLVVALSGGIDSSAIAAAAVEVAGPKDVVAITYDFDDPAHNSELGYAKAVSRKLGIRDHRLLTLRRRSFLETIPEAVWRAEAPVYWTKAFLLDVAKRVRREGFDHLLTGFGIGSHMSYLRELGRLLALLPMRLVTPVWRAALHGGHRWLELLARIHPGLEPPHPRLLYLLLRLLEEQGHIDDAAAGYPAWAAPLLRRSPVTLPDDPAPLWQQAQLQAVAHLVSCVDVTRSEKTSRELGVRRISPAHFARTIPFAYFPTDPPPRLWSAARLARPGKHLLQLAYRGMLPDEVLFRKKDWADAVASRQWRREGRVLMLRSLPDFGQRLRALGEDAAGAAALMRWEPRSILANGLSFVFWLRLFLERSPGVKVPPSWAELV